MKKEERILEVLGQVDEQYISEAAPQFCPKKKRPVWIKWSAAAACVCLCVLGAFQMLNPGMGKAAQVHHIVAVAGDLYYSVWDRGTYHYDRDEGEITKLSEDGSFYEVPSGLMLFNGKENTIYRVEENECILLGTSNVHKVLNDAAYNHLLDVRDGFAYWLGEAADSTAEQIDYYLVRTALTGEESEILFTFSDEIIRKAILRENQLYCYSHTYQTPRNLPDSPDSTVPAPDQIYSLNLNTGDIETLFTYDLAEDSAYNNAYFTQDFIIIQKAEGLFVLDYEGGEAVEVSKQIPSTHAIDYYHGCVYFYTDLPEGEFFRTAFVCVDLATKEIKELVQLTDGGVTRYTYIEAEVCDDGYYFTDPQNGLFYHSFIDGTDRQIVKG